MKPNTHQIQAAINAAEAVAKPLLPPSTPVTITQETLLALIDGSKSLLEALSDDCD